MLKQFLTIANGTIPTRSFWQMKISDKVMSVVPFRGYSTCQVMGWVPERLLKLAISKFICTTSLNKLLLLKKGKQERKELLLSLKKANEVNHISYWKMQLFICRYNTRPFPIYNFFRAHKLELFKMGQLLLVWILCRGIKFGILYLMKAKYTYSITCFLWFCKYDSTLLQDGFDPHQPKLSPV